ncbi:hypothetical protein [Pseudomonas sp. PSE14]|uniref:hypothetical protein n=1 Tax=Pseudomonas sp. PSE14 TaxID=3016341 RepID=UPI0023D7C8E9|nr:hypothetical protein [Pseudomonas sp. PSE14]WEJ71418.1 hypothetical protein O6P39_22590 [Pseudomonas sp. PSE14]
MNVPLSEQQERIILKIGKMMLNFQNFERKLKAILATRDLQGPIGELDTISRTQHSSYAKTMLGLLAGELTRKAIRPTDGVEDELELPADHIRMTITLHLEPAELDAFKRQLKTLVDDRNLLIHKFSEKFSLQEPDQWDAAEQFLDDLRARFIPLNNRVDQWISLLPNTLKALHNAPSE